MLKNKNVLVTGGAGFIGSHLVDAITKMQPENLFVLDNFFLGKMSNLEQAKNFEKIHILNYDLKDFFAVKGVFEDNNIDAVFNLAVLPLPASLTNPEFVYNNNILMTSVLCELARHGLFKTLIHYSSSEVYGDLVGTSISESHGIYPQTPYAASKAASDLNVMSYQNTFGIDASIVRPFNNYGPRQNEGTYAGVIPLTIKRVLNNEDLIIYGSGEQTRDYIYVTDTVDATIQIYNNTNTRGKVINVASGKEITINDLIKTILRLMERTDLKIKHLPSRPGDVHRHLANISLAKDIINFNPLIDFETGLKQTIQWYLTLKNNCFK